MATKEDTHFKKKKKVRKYDIPTPMHKIRKIKILCSANCEHCPFKRKC